MLECQSSMVESSGKLDGYFIKYPGLGRLMFNGEHFSFEQCELLESEPACFLKKDDAISFMEDVCNGRIQIKFDGKFDKSKFSIVKELVDPPERK